MPYNTVTIFYFFSPPCPARYRFANFFAPPLLLTTCRFPLVLSPCRKIQLVILNPLSWSHGLRNFLSSETRSKIELGLNFHPFYEGFLRISHKVTQVRAFPIKTLMMSKSALALGPDHESQSKSRIFYYLLLHAFLVCHHLNSPSPLSHDSGWRKVVCIKIAVMAAFNIWPLAMAKNIVTFKPKCIKPLPWKESKLGTPMHT